ncbi:glycosyltransferase [Nostocoides australiense]
MISLGQALVAGGAEVTFIGGHVQSCDSPDRVGPGPVVGVADLPRDRVRAVRGVRHLVTGGNLARWLRDQGSEKFDAVITYGGGVSYASRLSRWSKSTGTPVIVDCVEWYQPSHMAFGPLGPFAFDHELAMRLSYPRLGNIIAISEYLEDHFQSLGCRTIRVPPLVDTEDLLPGVMDCKDDVLRLVYAGSPGQKDLLETIIRAVCSVDPRGERLRLTVAGPSVNTVKSMLQSYGVHEGPINAVGKVSRAEALAHVRSADFSMLLRMSERYAVAGFASKVPESLALGTPIIANVTPELSKYVRDKDTGIIVSEPSVEAVACALQRCLALPRSAINDMSTGARLEAERSFDYRRYSAALTRWVEVLCNVGG